VKRAGHEQFEIDALGGVELVYRTDDITGDGAEHEWAGSRLQASGCGGLRAAGQNKKGGREIPGRLSSV